MKGLYPEIEEYKKLGVREKIIYNQQKADESKSFLGKIPAAIRSLLPLLKLRYEKASNFYADVVDASTPLSREDGEIIFNITSSYVVGKSLQELLKSLGSSLQVTRNLIDDGQSIADDIVEINMKYSNGNEMNNSISNIVNSASYYDDTYDQVSSITRSITQHAFENGNKRTAIDTMNMLLKDFNLKSPLNDTQKWDLVNDIAEGVISSVSEISRILQGN